MSSVRSDTHRRSVRQRRWLLWSGVALVAVAVLILGYVGWAIYGTTWLSHRKQADIVSTVQETWGTSTVSVGDRPVDVSAGEATALLRIPRFGDGYLMPILEGTSDDVLSAGVGHYSTTAGPGEVGNYGLAAHRITNGEPFRQMPELEVGDQVIVETATHAYTYELLTAGDALNISDDAGWVLASVPDNPEPGGVEPPQDEGQRLITLTTCADLFHSDNRLVAFGALVKVEPKS